MLRVRLLRALIAGRYERVQSGFSGSSCLVCDPCLSENLILYVWFRFGISDPCVPCSSPRALIAGIGSGLESELLAASSGDGELEAGQFGLRSSDFTRIEVSCSHKISIVASPSIES